MSRTIEDFYGVKPTTTQANIFGHIRSIDSLF